MSKRLLFTILILLMTAVMILSGILLSKFTQERLSENLVDQFYEQEELAAKQTAFTLENYTANITDKLYIISQLPEIRFGGTDECNKSFEQVIAITQLKVGNLARVGQDGRFTCSLNKALIGIEAATLGDYIPKIFNDPDHKPVLSRAIIPPGLTSHIAAVHVPVYDDEKIFIGTLGGAIYFNEIEEKILKDIKLSEEEAVVLIDDDGTILYHPTSELIGKNAESAEVQELNNNSHTYKKIIDSTSKNETGTMRYSFEGTEKIAAFAPVHILPDHNWTIIISVPLSEVDENLAVLGVQSLFSWQIGILSMIILLMTLSFLWYMIIQFFNPISKITFAAKKVSEGDWGVEVPKMRNDEIGTLAKVFSEMVVRLKSYYQNLEKEVAEKTKESEERVTQIKSVAKALETSNQELAQKMKELEKMNRFMVDREMKMTELKRENKELKIKISQ